MTESEKQADSGDEVVVEREIAAPAAQIFAILADPKLHEGADGMGMLRGTDAEAITGVGQSFDMDMHAKAMGGDYTMTNEVIVFEPDREIGWRPARKGTTPLGWTWTWQLDPIDAGRTRVRLTYDYSAVPDEERSKLGGFPPFPAEAFEASLEKLAETVEGAQPGGMQSILAPGSAPGSETTDAGNVAADVSVPHEFSGSPSAAHAGGEQPNDFHGTSEGRFR